MPAMSLPSASVRGTKAGYGEPRRMAGGSSGSPDRTTARSRTGRRWSSDRCMSPLGYVGNPTRFCGARTPASRRAVAALGSGGGLPLGDPLVQRHQKRPQGAVGNERVPRLLTDAGPAQRDVRQAREQVEPDVPGIAKIVPERVRVQERSALHPVLVRGVRLEDLGTRVRSTGTGGGGRRFSP